MSSACKGRLHLLSFHTIGPIKLPNWFEPVTSFSLCILYRPDQFCICFDSFDFSSFYQGGLSTIVWQKLPLILFFFNLWPKAGAEIYLESELKGPQIQSCTEWMKFSQPAFLVFDRFNTGLGRITVFGSCAFCLFWSDHRLWPFYYKTCCHWMEQQNKDNMDPERQ